MELENNPTTTVAKDQARPNWAEIGLWVSVLISVLIGWALWANVFADAWHAYHYPADGSDPVPRTEALRNLTWSMGTVGAVFAGFIGLVMAGFRTVALHRQSKTAQSESDLNAKKHQSEAFATAIEQLGHENFAVRLGAVYALESLAKSAHDLHGPIFETLCAYVRQKAPAPNRSELASEIDACGDTPVRIVIASHLQFTDPPDVVVQAILTVIGRRDPKRDPELFRLDLQSTDLTKADLRYGHFERSITNNSHLVGANMHAIRLEGAELLKTQLQGANLTYACLEEADLSNAQLQGAKLSHAHFEEADLSYAYLREADLSNAHLEGADLSDTHLEDTTLKYAFLQGSFLKNACLKGANISGSNLKGAFLMRVSFDALTDISLADLRCATLIPANITHDFRATVNGATTAQWPNDTDRYAWDRDD